MADALHDDRTFPKWVELRIHGVSGTPPESLLQAPHVVQVAGDDKRRVFQVADCEGKALPVDRDSGLLEGYHWGNLTSGSWRQALWLLLIPFGMVNAAAFMLPGRPVVGVDNRDPAVPAPTNRGRLMATLQWLCLAALRLLALTLTCLFSFNLSFIFVDLIGIRKAPGLDLPSWLQLGGVASLGLVASALVIFVLFWVGGKSGRFERNRRHTSYLGTDRSKLADWRFLSGDPSAPDMRRLHLAAGWAIATLPVSVILRDDAGGGPGDLHRWIWVTTIVLLAVVAVIVFAFPNPEDSVEQQTFGARPTGQKWWQAIVRFMSWLALLVAGLSTAVAVFQLWREGFNEHRHSMGALDEVSFALLVVTMVSLALLVLGNVVLALVTRPPVPVGLKHRFRPFAWGFAASALAWLGVFVALGFTGASSYASAKALGLSANGLPEILQRISYAWGINALITVAVVLLLGVWWVWRARFSWSRLRRQVRVDFAAEDGRLRIGESWERRVATSMWTARLKNRITSLVLLYVITGILMSVAAFIESAGSWRSLRFTDSTCPPGLGLGSGDWCDADHRWDLWGKLSGTNVTNAALVAIGSIALVALAGALVGVGRGAIKAQSKRRVANVIWDVIAFWPHSVHPFAPPAYSQAAVLHFRDRVRWHLYDHDYPIDGDGGPPPLGLWQILWRKVRGESEERAKHDEESAERASARAAARREKVPKTPVVIAAHSQGSLIAIAAMLWLTDEERKHVGFLTFGSQLQLIFPRAFPQYVNYWLLKELLDDTSLDRRWVNLYRETDPVAGPVLSWQHGKPASPAEMQSCSFPRPPAVVSPTVPTSDVVIEETGRRVGAGRYGASFRGCDWRLLDPEPAPGGDVTAQTGAVATIRGHSNFFADRQWATAVDAVKAPPGPTITSSTATETSG